MPALSGFGSANALGGFGAPPVAENRGILRTLIEETAQDFVGAGRTIVAPVGSLLEAFGATVPVSLDDLTKRDVKGAAMVTAMLVSGMAPKALGKLLPGISSLIVPAKDANFLMRSRATAIREAIAGAAFGLTRTALDPDEEDYFNNALADGVTFGALGVGFGAIGAATRSTLNAFKLVDKQSARAKLVLEAERVRDIQQRVQEFAGMGFRNPETLDTAYLWRDETTGNLLTQYWRHDKRTGKQIPIRRSAPEKADFGRGATNLLRLGYTDPLGYARAGFEEIGAARRFGSLDAPELRGLVDRGLLPAEDFDFLATKLGDNRLLRELDISQWKGFYVDARYKSETRAAFTKIISDAVTALRNEAGVPLTDIGLTPKDASVLVAELRGVNKRQNWFGDKGQLRSVEITTADGGTATIVQPRVQQEIVEEAFRQGLFDFRAMNLGMGVDEIVQATRIGQISGGFLYTPDANRASAMINILSGSNVARGHPEVKPFIDESQTRDYTLQMLNDRLAVFLENLTGEAKKIASATKASFGPREHSLIRKRIDESADVAWNVLGMSVKTYEIAGEHLPFQQAYAKAADLISKGKADDATLAAFDQLHDAWLQRSSASAIAAAKADGPVVEYVVDQLTNPTTGFFTKSLQLTKDAGLIAYGRPGYMPIYNRGAYILNIKLPGGGQKTIGGDRGFFDTMDAATKAWEEALREHGPGITGAIRNALVSFDSRGSRLSSSTWSQLAQRDAETLVKLGGSTGFSQRRLGLRDFESVDLIEALRIYGRSMNKRLAFSKLPQRLVDPNDAIHFDPTLKGFLDPLIAENPATAAIFGKTYIESTAEQIAAIPQSKPILRQWAQQQQSDMLGVPRSHEVWLDSFMEKHLGSSPRATKRYLGFIRSMENVFRLGGLGSMPVQVSQLLINLPAELGTVRTTKTILEYMRVNNINVLKPDTSSPFYRENIVALMKEAGVDPQFVASFAADHPESVFAALRRVIDTEAPSLRSAFSGSAAWDAISGMLLTPFTGAERLNRIVSFKAAFDAGIAEGKDRASALTFARGVMHKTQFNYHVSDMPELLRGPLGATILQFKSYFIKEMEFIAGLNDRQLAEFGAVMMSLGGFASILNLPGPDIANAAKAVFFDATIDESLKLGALEEIGIPHGSNVGDLLIYGMPGMFSEVHNSDRIGVGGFVDMLDFWGGPALSDIGAFKEFVTEGFPQLFKNGQISGETTRRWLNQAMPTDFRRMMLAHRFWKSGEYRDPVTKNLIYRSDDRFRAAMTYFSPSIELAENRAADRVTNRVLERARMQARDAAKGAAEAIRSGDQAAAQQILTDARARGVNVSRQSLNYWVLNFSKTGAERRERRLPLALRDLPELEALVRATGGLDEF